MPEPQPDATSPGVDPAVLESLQTFVQFAGSVADVVRRISLRYFRAGPELHRDALSVLRTNNDSEK